MSHMDLDCSLLCNRGKLSLLADAVVLSLLQPFCLVVWKQWMHIKVHITFMLSYLLYLVMHVLWYPAIWLLNHPGDSGHKSRQSIAGLMHRDGQSFSLINTD